MKGKIEKSSRGSKIKQNFTISHSRLMPSLPATASLDHNTHYTSRFTAQHDGMWYGTPLQLVGVCSPSCVSSELLCVSSPLIVGKVGKRTFMLCKTCSATVTLVHEPGLVTLPKHPRISFYREN